MSSEAFRQAHLLAAELTGTMSVMAFGAGPEKTHQENRAALQEAIAKCPPGGVVVVPAGICYGHKGLDPSTWPSFAGRADPALVVDYGPGASFSGFPKSYDGTQVREFFHTPQTESPGQHDGNTRYQAAPWHPGYYMNNNANYPSPGSAGRTSVDNRRASFGFMVDGWFTWAIIQGSAIGADLTNEEMSDFSIQMFPMPGDTLAAFCPYLVNRKTGRVAYGIGTQAPKAYHHFGAPYNPWAAPMALFEDYLGDRLDIMLRTKRGAVSDCSLSNVDGLLALRGEKGVEVAGLRGGVLRLSVPSAAALQIDAASRFIVVDASGNADFAIPNPINAHPGAEVTITIRSSGDKPLGHARWGDGYKMTPWIQPSIGCCRSISFACLEGGVLTETSRTADITN